jgi:hypothetical protein
MIIDEILPGKGCAGNMDYKIEKKIAGRSWGSGIKPARCEKKVSFKWGFGGSYLH